MFKLLHKNRKGFTIVEMLVTLVVLGMVLGMAGNLLYQLTNFNNMATYRYEIQNAVKMAYTKFDTNRNSIVQAYQADVLYDPVIAGGIKFNTEDISGRALEAGENKDFIWNNGTPKSMLADENNGYFTYIFSTPATDVDGNDLGMLLFIRHYNTNTYELYLDPEGMGTLPVEIRFAIGTNVPPTRSEDDYKKEETPTKYVSHSIAVTIKSGRDEVTNYAVDTAYTLENIKQNGKSINYTSSKLVNEPVSWNDGGKTGPAGWVHNSITNFPTSTALNFSSTDYASKEIDRLKSYGNIMRFISPEAYFSDDDVSGNPGTLTASCLTYFAMNGSKMAERVLDNLRLFRDNVLCGTEFGDWFIHQYYYVWSPFLIEHTAFLKPVYQAILIPVSYVCEFIAKL